jgi:hypothetical protein
MATNKPLKLPPVDPTKIHISHTKGGKLVRLGEFANAVEKSLNDAGLKNWEVELHVYVGVDLVIRAGFDATLRLSS